MNLSEVSKKYAKALYLLASEKKNESSILEELKSINAALQGDSQLKSFVDSPIIPAEKKSQLFSKILTQKSSLEVANFIGLLAEKGRLSLLPEITESFQLNIDNGAGVTRGTIKAAAALSREVIQDLESKISKVINKKVILTFKEDHQLIGGVVVQAGGWTFDDSIESHLKRLGEDLNRRAN
jgi:F-type H+-transporting ATPase subunit delta